jgi:hypothetical protein
MLTVAALTVIGYPQAELKDHIRAKAIQCGRPTRTTNSGLGHSDDVTDVSWQLA